MKRTGIHQRPIVLVGAMALLGVTLVTAAGPANARAVATSEPSTVAVTTATLFDLNGTYTDGGTASPVISNINDILTVDMSSQHRPNANGVVVNNDTIIVTFADDHTYGAKLAAPGIIRWSNGSTWRKVTFATVPDVVEATSAVATAQLHSAGFAVQRRTKPTCEVKAGLVAAQNPAGGASAPVGATVEITIAVKPKITCQ